jgi:ribosomal protein S18 acetylase RimI-like enzyme
VELVVRSFGRADRPELERILEGIALFSPEEVACALELADIFLNDPRQGDYRALAAVQPGNKLVGYACFGPVPLTRGTYDLYWVAVAPMSQRLGIGSLLLRRVEEVVEGAGGRLLLIQTSGRPDYDSTRSFYTKNGYVEVARIADYYAPGDDGVIFEKRF